MLDGRMGSKNVWDRLQVLPSVPPYVSLSLSICKTRIDPIIKALMLEDFYMCSHGHMLIGSLTSV